MPRHSVFAALLTALRARCSFQIREHLTTRPGGIGGIGASWHAIRQGTRDPLQVMIGLESPSEHWEKMVAIWPRNG